MVNLSSEVGWNFDNSYIKLPEVFYTPTNPIPVNNPKLVLFNDDLANDIGLNLDYINEREITDELAGNIVPKGAYPIAQAYAGHQFGYFTKLGDGRAVLLGEQITVAKDRYDIQLKGSGKTVYSRGGDGRAPLGPMLREYIISEGMFGLGIPTTRSLAVVKSGECITRQRVEQGAVLTRIAKSHIRVGTFEYASKYCSLEDLRKLADYTIARHFNDLIEADQKYLMFLRAVIRKQVDLIVKWQLVGFVHGVMNTDNMAISGETIDYGPCAFMDKYDKNTVFSSIDLQGRYAYGNQPKIGIWNLSKFAESLLPLIHEDEQIAIKLVSDEIMKFGNMYLKEYNEGMKKKIGLFGHDDNDEGLIKELLELMYEHEVDYTNTFRDFTLDRFCDGNLYKSEDFKKWFVKYEARLKNQNCTKEERIKIMKENNPAVIPRNYRVEEAISAAVFNDNYSKLQKLLEVLKNPYDYSKGQDEYAKLPPKSFNNYRTFCGT